MEAGRADEWKNNLDAHAFLNTFINCAASDNREYFRDIIQTYNDVLRDGKLVCDSLLVIIGKQVWMGCGCDSLNGLL